MIFEWVVGGWVGGAVAPHICTEAGQLPVEVATLDSRVADTQPAADIASFLQHTYSGSSTPAWGGSGVRVIFYQMYLCL